MQFENIHTLLTPEKLPYLSGIERLSNGVLHVAALTRMPNVSPQMIHWWFSEYMQTTEDYKRWHPRDHVWMQWQNKSPGTVIGAQHCVHEYIGGHLNKIQVSFVPDTDFFGNALSSQKENSITNSSEKNSSETVDTHTLALCAYSGLLNTPLDMVRMVHFAVAKPWGCELHSRFWVGYFSSRSDSTWLAKLCNRVLFRKLLIKDNFGRALLTHCHEEMTTLAGFLPELHKKAHLK